MRWYIPSVMADNGGIHAAYNGFKRWQTSQDPTTQGESAGLPFTQDQMFFIGVGQVSYVFRHTFIIYWVADMESITYNVINYNYRLNRNV
jgi:hypothetical protein